MLITNYPTVEISCDKCNGTGKKQYRVKDIEVNIPDFISHPDKKCLECKTLITHTSIKNYESGLCSMCSTRYFKDGTTYDNPGMWVDQYNMLWKGPLNPGDNLHFARFEGFTDTDPKEEIWVLRSSEGPKNATRINEEVPKCPGCGRYELHKRCPAYGTRFYLSGIDYTPEIERIVRTCKSAGYYDADKAIYTLLTQV